MAKEARIIEPERIVFEPTGKDGLWRMRAEGGDVEAHSVSWDRFSAEPAAKDQSSGEALFKVSLEGEDVEGHHCVSDARLKRNIEPVAGALERLRSL